MAEMSDPALDDLSGEVEVELVLEPNLELVAKDKQLLVYAAYYEAIPAGSRLELTVEADELPGYVRYYHIAVCDFNVGRWMWSGPYQGPNSTVRYRSERVKDHEGKIVFAIYVEQRPNRKSPPVLLAGGLRIRKIIFGGIP